MLISNRDERRRLQDELRDLDEDLARLLAAGHADGFSVRKMAQRAGISHKKAYAMLDDGRRLLRAWEAEYDAWLTRYGPYLRAARRDGKVIVAER